MAAYSNERLESLFALLIYLSWWVEYWRKLSHTRKDS